MIVSDMHGCRETQESVHICLWEVYLHGFCGVGFAGDCMQKAMIQLMQEAQEVVDDEEGV